VGQFILSAAVVIGCARGKPRPPAIRSIEISGIKAEYRDTHDGNVCDAGAERLTKEEDAISNLLAHFLTASAPVEGRWSPEAARVLKDAAPRLDPLLSAQEDLSRGLVKCHFPSRQLDSAVAAADQLTAQARARTAPDVLERLRAAQAWHDAITSHLQPAREEWCPPKPKPGKVVIFYAAEDETGAVEWFFCDSRTVRQPLNDAPALLPEAEPEKKPGKVPSPKAYLDAAKRYPTEEIARPPKPAAPPNTPPPSEDAGAADTNAGH
jgi:hypothetical protein